MRHPPGRVWELIGEAPEGVSAMLDWQTVRQEALLLQRPPSGLTSVACGVHWWLESSRAVQPPT